MFTGLVEAVGRLVGREPLGEAVQLQIASPIAAELALGDSLAVNGVCLTVVAAGDGSIRADVGPETMRVTTLGRLKAGALVNLERPLRPDSRIGGHFVQGHVDAVGEVLAVRPDGEFHWMTVRFPRELARYLVPKGSVAVDGISLTVARLDADTFDVQLVPYTVEHTNAKGLQPRDAVNLESDMVGKYVVRAVEAAGLIDTVGKASEQV